MIRIKRLIGQQKHTRRVAATKKISVILLFLAFALPVFGQVNYRFNDKPRPEADVIIVQYGLAGNGGEMWLVGRVFNRGLKPAHNVRINPNLVSRYGTRPPANMVYLTPSDIPPTSFADFEGRVALYSDLEISARPTVEWDP